MRIEDIKSEELARLIDGYANSGQHQNAVLVAVAGNDSAGDLKVVIAHNLESNAGVIELCDLISGKNSNADATHNFSVNSE